MNEVGAPRGDAQDGHQRERQAGLEEVFGLQVGRLEVILREQQQQQSYIAYIPVYSVIGM
jgi:hypothetical protein